MTARRRDLLEAIGPLHRSLRRIEEECAQAEGLTMWRYAILSVASAHGGLSQAAIADRLGYSKNRIVGDLDTLVERGLAERRPGGDRRANAIFVTSAGRALVADIRAKIWRREDALLQHLSPGERETLRELLGAAAAPLQTAGAR